MVIQHNLPAMNSHRQLGINNSSTSKNLEKLSSGYKINRAGDDAAGLAISEKMRGQIRGLDMATTNTENGVSLIQTAEGGLNETHSILQRMRELAVQSANGTYADDVDRENINKEVQALKDEIDRISSSTHYNGIKLLDGSLGGQRVKDMSITDAEDAMSSMGFSPDIYQSLSLFQDGEQYVGQEAKLIVSGGSTDGTGTSATVTLQIGDKSYKHDANDKRDFYEIQNGVTVVIAALFNNYQGSSVSVSGVITIKSISAANTSTFIFDDDSTIATEKSQLVFQIGANGAADQRVGLHIDNMSSGFLGSSRPNPTGSTALDGFKVIDVQLDTREKANDSIKILEDAINQVSGTRADLGALQNRLEHTVNNLGTTRENLQAAESSIRDVDMAKEMMEFTKNNILVQASQSMLAQSNQLPQGVLSLLR